MKSIFSLALGLAISSTAYAAPASTPKTIAPMPVKSFDPVAVALLDQSAKSYAALDGLSMDYKAFEKKRAKIKRLSGSVAYSGSHSAKVVISVPGESVFTLTNGTKLYSQVDATTVQGTPIKKQDAREAVISRVPSAASVPLPVLVAGKSPLTLQYMKWQSAQLLPHNGVKLIATPGGPPLTFNLYFDDTSLLLRRVEFMSTKKGVQTLNVTDFTNLQIDPTFADSAFNFTPGKGVKVVAEVPMFDPKLKVGVKPYALKSKDFRGNSHPWNKYAGKVVLLDFWATWCGPCVGELPNVLKNYKTYHSKGFEIIGVSLDDDKQELTDFIRTRKLWYPNLYDGQGWSNVDAKRYIVRGIPFTLLIGKDGRIAAVNPRAEKLQPAILKALKG